MADKTEMVAMLSGEGRRREIDTGVLLASLGATVGIGGALVNYYYDEGWVNNAYNASEGRIAYWQSADSKLQWNESQAKHSTLNGASGAVKFDQGKIEANNAKITAVQGHLPGHIGFGAEAAAIPGFPVVGALLFWGVGKAVLVAKRRTRSTRVSPSPSAS